MSGGSSHGVTVEGGGVTVTVTVRSRGRGRRVLTPEEFLACRAAALEAVSIVRRRLVVTEWLGLAERMRAEQKGEEVGGHDE
jgi:hypothetical protein